MTEKLIDAFLLRSLPYNLGRRLLKWDSAFTPRISNEEGESPEVKAPGLPKYKLSVYYQLLAV
jgi:hypothetical protein